MPEKGWQRSENSGKETTKIEKNMRRVCGEVRSWESSDEEMRTTKGEARR